MRVIGVCALVSLAFAAQAPSFEVASVKPSAPDDRVHRPSTKGDRFSYYKIPLKTVLMMAYQVKDYQIDGPAWIAAERYDILAKAPENTPKDRIPLMLQTLLAERFGLTLHREIRELPVFELTVANSGAKLKEAAPQPSMVFVVVNGHREARGLSMPRLVAFLTLWLGWPVIDKTGLRGAYDFPLETSREERGGPNSDAPSIFTALQEVGLKLESRKAPVEMIVVDAATKTPTEN